MKFANNAEQQVGNVETFEEATHIYHRGTKAMLGNRTLSSLKRHICASHGTFNLENFLTKHSAHINVNITDARDELSSRLANFNKRSYEPSLTDTLDEHDISKSKYGHNTPYYHSTLLPIHPMELDIDTEDEVEPEWLHHKRTQKIDENIHLNDGEKAIMKMWNLHMIKYGFVGKSQMPLACDMFVENHGQELLCEPLYCNYVLHLCNLCDCSIISAADVHKNLLKLKGTLSADQITNK